MHLDAVRHKREAKIALKPAFTDVKTVKSASGFYEGHSQEIALLSKGIMVALVIWALV